MMNKTILCVALSTTTLLTATSAIARLPVNASLSFIPGVVTLNSSGAPIVKSGSYFGMDNSSDGIIRPNERTAIAVGVIGLSINKTQATPGDIDSEWSFFSSFGNHTSISNTTILSDDGDGNVTLDFSGWNVDWSNVPFINMGGGQQDCGTDTDGICVASDETDIANVGGVPYNNGTGIATMTCTASCAEGDSYVLVYDAFVPQADPSNFGGVKYTLYMEGIIGLQAATNTAPVANDVTPTVDRQATGRPYTSPVIDIVANDTDDDGIGDIDRTTVSTMPVNGITTFGTFIVDDVTGNITYTPNEDFLGDDTFNYVVSDKGGPTSGDATPDIKTSETATVTITVQNAVPVAEDDTANMDPAISNSVLMDVTDNDTDSDGSISTVVNINPIDDATNGTTSIDGAGDVTYTPDSGFIGIDTFKYTVQDNDGTPSNLATVVVTVATGSSNLPEFILFNAGTGVPGEGTFFTMEVNPGQLTAVGLTGFNHIQLDSAQLASVAMPDIDDPWQFFGNLGVHQTTKTVSVITDDFKGNVTLDFSGWDVSWNNIASIPLGEGPDNGIASMTCAIDCAIGETYSLIYHATVPPGDPSGFGGVQYILHMDGILSDVAPVVGGGDVTAPYDVTDANPIVAVDDSTSVTPNPVMIGPGATAINAGNTTGVNLTAGDIGVKDPALNEDDGEQCIGGCADFIATGVTTDFIDFSFRLSKPLPSGAVYRKLINGKWDGFDTASGGQVGSADADTSGNCQGPEGKYNTGLREGASCIFIRIYDGGPNDEDGVKNGTIVDPSGALLAGSSNVPSGSSSGCSISNTNVNVMERADWFIVAGFIVWLGLIGYRRNKNLS